MKLTKREYASEPEKKKDFRLGFIGWFVGNIALCLATSLGSGLALYGSGASGSNNTIDMLIGALNLLLSLLPWIINIGLIIFFALTRSQIALGMLMAFGASVLAVILLGIIFLVACFVMSYGSSL